MKKRTKKPSGYEFSKKEKNKLSNYLNKKKNDKSKIILTILVLTAFVMGSLFLIAFAYNRFLVFGKVPSIVLTLLVSILVVTLIIISLCGIYKYKPFLLGLSNDSAMVIKSKNKSTRDMMVKNILDMNKNHILGFENDQYIDTLKENYHLGKDGQYHRNLKHFDEKKVNDSIYSLIKKGGLVHNRASNITRNKAIECGTLTAISQSGAVDSALIAIKNIEMIQNIIACYGFRPTNKEMFNLYFKVIQNAIAGFGISEFQFGKSIAKKIIPLDASNPAVIMLSKLIDSGIQFGVNGAMTYFLGRKTVETLISEYNIQRMLGLYIDEYNLSEDLLLDEDPLLGKEIKNEIRTYKKEQRRKRMEKIHMRQFKFEGGNI